MMILQEEEAISRAWEGKHRSRAWLMRVGGRIKIGSIRALL